MESKKDVSKIILEEMKLSKESLKKKNDDIMGMLTSYKKDLLKNNIIDDKDKEDSLELNEASLFEYDDEYGYMFDLNGANKEELEAVNDVLLKDPIFALKFLERKRDFIPEEEYKILKSKIIGKITRISQIL